MTSFAVRSFGCRVNQAEAFGWVEALRRGGLLLEEDAERGDYLLVNSCTLTGRADRDVRRFIRRAARANPEAKIIVTGCYAARAPEELLRMPGVRLVVPNAGKDGLAARILEEAGAREGEAASEAVPYRARAFLKVQDGCDFHCAYCVIPGVRGKSASLPADEVVGRVKALVAGGYREIVLAGVHLSSYGRDLEPRGSLLALLERVEAVAGLGRVRLSSLDPRFLDEPLAAHITASPRIAPHFHLSLQSGSAATLRAMGRASSPESYEAALSGLRRRSPDAALGADIIVGFPGETDAEFERTREFLERSPLTYFHVFPFSPREGTPAAGMEPVDEAVKAGRADALRDLSRAKGRAFREGLVGRELEAVVIKRKDRGAEVLTGNNISLFVPDCQAVRREFVTVRITEGSGLNFSTFGG